MGQAISESAGLLKQRERIGFVTSAFLPEREPGSSFDYFAVLTTEVLRHLQRNYDVVVRVPTPKTLSHISEEQNIHVEEILTCAAEMSGLIICPADVDLVSQTLLHWLSENSTPIPVVTIDQSLGASTSWSGVDQEAPSAVVPDNVKGGALAAEALGAYAKSVREWRLRPGRPEKFLVVMGTGTSSDRTDGFENEIKKNFPNAEVEQSEPLNYARSEAETWMGDFLSKGGWADIVGVFACNDELALGVCDALDAYTLEQINTTGAASIPPMAVVGFDGIRDATRRLDNLGERWLINSVQIPVPSMARELADLIKNTISGAVQHPRTIAEACTLCKPLTYQPNAKTLDERRMNWANALRRKLQPDILLLTIKTEEEDALEHALNESFGEEEFTIYQGRHKSYRLRTISRSDKNELSIALIRQSSQGVLSAQDTARDAIEDLAPRLIFIVGIAGGIAASEYNLGDVIIGTKVYDFTVGEYKEAGWTWSARAPYTHPKLSNFLSSLNRAKLNEKLKDISEDQPPVTWNDDANYIGGEIHKERLKGIMKARFGEVDAREYPICYLGAIASDGFLVKDPTIAHQWLHSGRDAVAIDMEYPGVNSAAQRIDNNYPVLVVRSLSDIVGFKRDGMWTEYACKAAAHAAVALLLDEPALGILAT